MSQPAIATQRCPYCGSGIECVNTAVIYGRSYGKAWVCERWPDCDAYVGCHGNTRKPLGTLANGKLRKLRNHLHRLFDPLWRDGDMTRDEAYRWLADKLGLPQAKAHIAMLNEDRCELLIEELS